jgi:hypothetical protein
VHPRRPPPLTSQQVHLAHNMRRKKTVNFSSAPDSNPFYDYSLPSFSNPPPHDHLVPSFLILHTYMTAQFPFRKKPRD